MRKKLVVIAAVLLLSGCVSVSPYDPVLDKGIAEFSEQFNAFVKDMGDYSGKPEGTYDANMKTYNALSAKLDVLIARASRASEGKNCRLEKKMTDKLEKVLQNDIPPALRNLPQDQQGNADACNAKLLDLVKKQLEDVRTIHMKADKCDSPAGKISCLRPATVETAVKIANQSIDAAAVVEAAKKTMTKED